MEKQAIGLIEVIGFTCAVEAADASLKAANVTLLGVEKVSGGIVTVILSGDVGAIHAATEAGAASVKHLNEMNFRAKQVIPRIDKNVFGKIIKKRNGKEPETSDVITQQTTTDKIENKENTSIKTEEMAPGITQEKKDDLEVELANKSVRELKELITSLGIKISAEKLRTARKQELINIVKKFYKEGDK